MTNRSNNISAWLRISLVVLGGSIVSGCDTATPVTTVSVQRGNVEDVIAVPAVTAIEKTTIVAMPLNGRISAVLARPGDVLEAGTAIAEVDVLPLRTMLAEAEAKVAQAHAALAVNAQQEIEQTLRKELTASVAAGLHVLKAAEGRVQAGKRRVARVQAELARVQALARTDSVSEQALDDAQFTADTAEIELREVELLQAALITVYSVARLAPEYVDQWLTLKKIERGVLEHQLTEAEAARRRAAHALATANLKLRVGGVVLQRFDAGGRVLQAGYALARSGPT